MLGAHLLPSCQPFSLRISLTGLQSLPLHHQPDPQHFQYPRANNTHPRYSLSFLHSIRNITSISLAQFPGDLNLCLLQIADSGLEVETLDVSNNHSPPVDGLSRLGENMRKSLRVLNCSHMGILFDLELNVIADSMPFLEELDISHPRDLLDFSHTFYLPFIDPKETRVSDAGIERLASSVTNLRKINISGHQFATDRSIISISSSYIHLTMIKLLYCTLITHSGLHFLINNCANLNSLSLEGNQSSHSMFPIQYLSSSSTKPLSSLHMYNLIASDEFLFSITNANDSYISSTSTHTSLL